MSSTTRGIKQRTAAGVALLLLGLASVFVGLSTTTASATPPDGKVVVCKYVSTPGGVLDHIVVVASNTITGFSGSFPYEWTDAHGQSGAGSIAIRFADEGPPPEQASTIALSECPSGGPTDSSTPTSPASPSSSPTDIASSPSSPATSITVNPSESSSNPSSPATSITVNPSESSSNPSSPATSITVNPSESSRPGDPGDPGDPNDPGNPNQPGDKDPEVLGIEQNAPAAAPTAVDAGLSGEESGSSSTLWILAGAALALVGLVIGFVPSAPRGKRAL